MKYSALMQGLVKEHFDHIKVEKEKELLKEQLAKQVALSSKNEEYVSQFEGESTRLNEVRGKPSRLSSMLTYLWPRARTRTTAGGNMPLLRLWALPPWDSSLQAGFDARCPLMRYHRTIPSRPFSFTPETAAAQADGCHSPRCLSTAPIFPAALSHGRSSTMPNPSASARRRSARWWSPSAISSAHRCIECESAWSFSPRSP